MQRDGRGVGAHAVERGSFPKVRRRPGEDTGSPRGRGRRTVRSGEVSWTGVGVDGRGREGRGTPARGANGRGRRDEKSADPDDQISVGFQVGGPESPGGPSGCVLHRVHRGRRRRAVPTV